MSESPKLVRASVRETEEYFLVADRRNPKKPKVVWLVGIPCLVALVLSVNDTRRDFAKGKPLWWLPGVVIGSFCVLMLIWLGPLGKRHRIRKAIRGMVAQPPTEAHFEFSDAGFLSTGREGRSSFHPWTTVPEVYVFSDGIAPILDANLNIYFWIPSSAFASPTAYEDVLALVSAKVQKVQHRKP